jgi:Zn-finger nucleic acid-binding protein
MTPEATATRRHRCRSIQSSSSLNSPRSDQHSVLGLQGHEERLGFHALALEARSQAREGEAVERAVIALKRCRSCGTLWADGGELEDVPVLIACPCFVTTAFQSTVLDAAWKNSHSRNNVPWIRIDEQLAVPGLATSFD